VAWVALTVAAIRTHDDLAGVAMLFLALYAVLALVVIWSAVAATRIVRTARHAAMELHRRPPE
jgi:hypothetical protein